MPQDRNTLEFEDTKRVILAYLTPMMRCHVIDTVSMLCSELALNLEQAKCFKLN